MPVSKVITLQVSDIIKWFKAKELVINETFQRRAVWTTAAKTYLIDTLLREMPIPKIYLRTRINPKKQITIREIIDGQQRIRAMVEFANDDLRLSSRSEDYAGKKYSGLDPIDQEKFLGYTISAEQLLTSSDDDVLEIFARLNSYTVVLTAAEKRHAEFQTEFKWAVRKSATEWGHFWERRKILTIKQRFRMADDSLTAELYGILLQGVTDGGAPNINKIYKHFDDDKFTQALAKATRAHFNATLEFFDTIIGDDLPEILCSPHQFVMVFAAYAFVVYGIPDGQVDSLPPRKKIASTSKIKDGLSELDVALSADDEYDGRYERYIEASKSSTQRIASRRSRFAALVNIFQ